MTRETFIATAHADSAAAVRYLGQLCKHFAHKIPVDYRPEAAPPEGVAHFPWGTCRMRAENGTLTVTASARSAEDLYRIKVVVDSHLRRFGWREDLVLVWNAWTRARSSISASRQGTGATSDRSRE